MKILRNAHALLFPMSDTPLNKSRCSSKIFAYIAAKRPVIAHQVGEVANLLKDKANFYSPGTDLVEILEELPENLDDIKYKNKEFSYEAIAEKYIKLIDELN